jgi:hypothetical protein
VVVKFVGGTTFVRRGDRRIEAVHPHHEGMPHYSMIVGRCDQWMGPAGSRVLDPGRSFLHFLHPDLTGKNEDYWVWCPDGHRVTVSAQGSTAVSKKADRLVVLRRHFRGNIVRDLTRAHARLVVDLNGGWLDDAPSVNQRAASGYWYFAGYPQLPLALDDVCSYSRQGDDLALVVDDLDGQGQGQRYELPDRTTTLYVSHMPHSSAHGPANVVHHHHLARTLAEDPEEFDRQVPILISRTLAPTREHSIDFPKLCSDDCVGKLTPPDSEFCVNCEL